MRVMCYGCSQQTNVIDDMGFFCEHCGSAIDITTIASEAMEKIDLLEETVKRLSKEVNSLLSSGRAKAC